MIRLISLLTVLAAGGWLAFAGTPTTAAGRLHSLLEEDWQWRLREFPENSTLLGDSRYNDRLTDLSVAAIEKRKAHEREMLARIQDIDRSALAGQDLISYDLFLRDKKLSVEGQRFSREVMPINQMDGPQLSFPQLAGATALRTTKDCEAYIARLQAFPAYVDQLIGLLRLGIEKKWVPPALQLADIPQQIENQIALEPDRSPYYAPFEKFSPDINEAERARFTKAGREAIASAVIPALRKLSIFLKQTYLPACRSTIAVTSIPDGQAYYEFLARHETTTDRSPKEIHEIGKKEVARIRKEMETLIAKIGFRGSFADFLSFLRSDPRFYHTRPEDLIAGYRDICKRIDAELPRLFAELPRNPYGVREIAAYEAPRQTTAYYFPGAPDGSRAGIYYANTYKLNTRPKYEMEALSLHEAVPGHHLQISRAQELKELPPFRRNGSYTAYVEGWGLYAESLGEEMGLYTDPYAKFGQLTYEMWRACRLVVDTGMHAFGWSRQEAIDLLLNNSGKTANDIAVEVDRYIVWPGQALAYKIGELKIKELRAKAKKELGERFDIRRFHNALLDDGPLPLDVLEKRIDEWIGEQRKE